MLPQPASDGAGPSGRLPAAVLAATSLVSRPPRTAMHALRPGTLKRPPSAVASQPDLNRNQLVVSESAGFSRPTGGCPKLGGQTAEGKNFPPHSPLPRAEPGLGARSGGRH